MLGEKNDSIRFYPIQTRYHMHGFANNKDTHAIHIEISSWGGE